MAIKKVEFKKVSHTFFTGDTTCAYGKGKFCPFVVTKKFGTHYVCILFNTDLNDDENMCLKRSSECIAKLDKMFS